MKCLSVCQPFADLIVRGKKTVELRGWNTRFRGEFLVHSPQRVRIPDCRRLGMRPDSLATGAIIGKATIYDVTRYETVAELRRDRARHHAAVTGPEPGRGHRYGFLLKSPKVFRIPIPYKGGLGFFDAKLPNMTGSPDGTALAEIIDEEHRYRLVGHH